MTGCLNIAMMALLPLGFATLNSTAPDIFINQSVEKLKHPSYSTAYLDPELNEPTANFETAKSQQLEFEDFMKFARYTNTKRIKADGKETKSYNPQFDFLGPNNWLPLQCTSSVDEYYRSPIFGYIKNGNDLENDILLQF